jgi:hypothetical protein
MLRGFKRWIQLQKGIVIGAELREQTGTVTESVKKVSNEEVFQTGEWPSQALRYACPREGTHEGPRRHSRVGIRKQWREEPGETAVGLLVLGMVW